MINCADEIKQVKANKIPEHIGDHVEYRNGLLWWKTPKPGRFLDKPILRGYRYRSIYFEGHSYQQSRVIWFLCKGTQPKGEIDHVDGNTLNNHIDNLREATSSENICNTPVQARNKLGIKGLCVCDELGEPKLIAQVRKQGRSVRRSWSLKKKYSLEEAIALAKPWLRKTRKELHGEFAHD